MNGFLSELIEKIRKMEDWEKSDVFQSLNKLLLRQFPNLFRNEGLVFNAEFYSGDLAMVYPLPLDQNTSKLDNLNLLLGPFQLIFSLKNDTSSNDNLVSDDKSSYDLTFRLNTYHGKVLKEDISSLIFDPESREIQMSESIFQILKKVDCFIAESDEGNFHLCCGISSNKNLKIDQLFIELLNSDQVVTRSRDCTYLVEFEILFSDEMSETVSTEKCNVCSNLEKESVVCSKVSGLDLLKQLPPGIAIQSSGTSHPKKPEPEPKKNSGVVIIKDGKTTLPLPNRRSQPVRPVLPRKRVVENIPVMTAADLSDDDLSRFQVFNSIFALSSFQKIRQPCFLKRGIQSCKPVS